MNNTFVQFHVLCSYPAALLNRDDVGFAKRMPFGGATRTRISSQCLKRHWRTHQGMHALAELGVPASVRSRLTFERFVLQPLIDEGVDEALARAVTEAFMAQLLGESAKAKKARGAKEDAAPEPLRTGQITILGRPEVDFVLAEARAVCADGPAPKKAAAAVKDRLGKDGRANLKALAHASGLDAALFGRMVTSDILARGDAALHVAHAFTVHAEATETDYFSAVDDLLAGGDDEQLGSGHIGNAELTSGLFYLYVVVDVALLVSNLQGCPRAEWQEADRSLAAQVVARLPWLLATVSPGAKLGSTAPHSYAHLVLAEAGAAQPRTLANAFLAPVSQRPDVLLNTYERLGAHVADLDRMYGRPPQRSFSALGSTSALQNQLSAGDPCTLAELADWVSGQVRGE